MEKNCSSETLLFNYLHKIDNTDRVYRLLRWILTVNRPALLKVPPKNQITEMKTQYQYMMVKSVFFHLIVFIFVFQTDGWRRSKSECPI